MNRARLFLSKPARSPKPVQVALALIGLEFDATEVDLAAEQQFKADFTALNPNRRVPVFVTPEGLILSQSGAILEYLAERYPDACLMPTDIDARFKVREIMHLLGCDVRPLGNREPILRLMQEIGTTDRKRTNGWSIHWFQRGFDALEPLLERYQSHHNFCVGNRITNADLLVGTEVWAATTRFADAFQNMAEHWPRVWTVYQHLLTLPAFRTAHGLT